MLKKTRYFFSAKIWNFPLRKLHGWRYVGVKLFRVFVLSLRDFFTNNMMTRATSMTFYTLMALVPLLAISFAIAKGFGLQEFLQKGLLTRFPQQQAILEKIISLAQNLLDKTQGGVLAVFAIAFLLWYTIKLVLHMEKSIGIIWRSSRIVSWRRCVGDYFVIILVIPLFFILYGILIFVIFKKIHYTMNAWSLHPIIFSTFWFLVKLLPYVLVIATFIFLYLFLPKVKVKFTAALFGGFIAACIYLVLQFFYIYFQLGIIRYSVIYGSFASLPLLLIWIQLSWVIFFYGAELSFSLQNVKFFEYEKSFSFLSYHCKILLCLFIVQQCIKNFQKDKQPIDCEDLAAFLHLPLFLTKDLLEQLTKAGIFCKISSRKNHRDLYQFCVVIDSLHIKDVINAINNYGIQNIPWLKGKSLKILEKKLQAFDELMQKAKENILLKDISTEF